MQTEELEKLQECVINITSKLCTQPCRGPVSTV